MEGLPQFRLREQLENQAAMAAYMKDHFSFLGVRAPARKEQSKELIRSSKEISLEELFIWIDFLYQKSGREYQYVAIDVAIANVKRFSLEDISYLAHYVMEKSWWDSVDSWRKLFGDYVVLHQVDKEAVFGLFYKHPNFWMRRIAILLQLTEKATLNQELLKKAIVFDQKTDEFFIQKAIGWALRSYSKTNPQWVKAMIANYQLSPLAIREGSKYL